MNPAFVAIVYLALAASGGLSATDDPSKAEAHTNLGLQLAQQGDLVHAESELRQAAQLAPSDPEILASLGTVLAMERKFEESSTVFRKELKLSPHDVTVRRYLAANLWQLHQYAESKQNLEILLQEQPNDEAARLLLGMVAEDMQDYATAARMLSSVPGQLQQHPESVAALARSYYHLGRTNEARTTLAQLSGGGPQAVLMGAGVADEMHDYQTAEELLLSNRASFPDPAAFGYRVALVQYHAGRYGDSQHTLLGLIEAGHPSGRIYNLRGWCFYKQNQMKEAVQALNHAIDAAPEDETNFLDLGAILAGGHSLPSALALARRGTAAFPNSARMFELQGSVEAKSGQFAEAEKSYARAVELDPSRPDGVAGLAEAQFSTGRAKEATATLEAGIKRFPKAARLKVLYASVLMKEAETAGPPADQRENDRRAEEMLQSALALDLSLPSAHYELGKLELSEGRLPEAVKQLEEAVKLDPQDGEAHFALSRAYRRAGRKSDSAQQMELYERLKQVETQAEAPASSSETPSRF